MKIEKECNCCGALYSILYTELPHELDPEFEDQELDEESEFYPEFCPFCGSHESDEEGLDDED